MGGAAAYGAVGAVAGDGEGEDGGAGRMAPTRWEWGAAAEAGGGAAGWKGSSTTLRRVGGCRRFVASIGEGSERRCMMKRSVISERVHGGDLFGLWFGGAAVSLATGKANPRSMPDEESDFTPFLVF